VWHWPAEERLGKDAQSERLLHGRTNLFLISSATRLAFWAFLTAKMTVGTGRQSKLSVQRGGKRCKHMLMITRLCNRLWLGQLQSPAPDHWLLQ
jgi:hypothetical protein